MKKFFEEFKAFAIKGNAMDLAVGMMVGAAFTSIVNSLVNNIISPLIGLLVKVDFSDLVLKIGEVDVQYGAFIMAIINFLIVAPVSYTHLLPRIYVQMVRWFVQQQQIGAGKHKLQ